MTYGADGLLPANPDPGQELNVQAVGDRDEAYDQLAASCSVIPVDWDNTGNLVLSERLECNICWEIAREDTLWLVMYITSGFFAGGGDAVWFAPDARADPEPALAFRPTSHQHTWILGGVAEAPPPVEKRAIERIARAAG